MLFWHSSNSKYNKFSIIVTFRQLKNKCDFSNFEEKWQKWQEVSINFYVYSKVCETAIAFKYVTNKPI